MKKAKGFKFFKQQYKQQFNSYDDFDDNEWDYNWSRFSNINKPPGYCDNEDELIELCYYDPIVVINSFSSKTISERNDDFYYSQKEENYELDYWLDRIEETKKRSV